MPSRRPLILMLALAALAIAAGCGGGSSSSSSPGSGASSTPAAGGKGGTFIALANSNWGTADPAKNYTLQEWQLLIWSHDGLVSFKIAGGPAGNKIVPNLATEVPKPTDGGKTYTFTLRPGIKYSDGTPVKASDFLAPCSRAVHGAGPGGLLLGHRRADACVKTPKTCDLSKGIVADDAAGTVTFHLIAPDPEFLQKLALPFMFVVPANTPTRTWAPTRRRDRAVHVADLHPNKGSTLRAQPELPGVVEDAAPEGYPDKIEYKFGLTGEAEVTKVENGQADWMFDQPPADRLNEIGTKYADQVHLNPLAADYYMALNVERAAVQQPQGAPGDQLRDRPLRHRQGLRRPVARQPTCQILPPNFPGYEPYCPYTTGGGRRASGRRRTWPRPSS